MESNIKESSNVIRKLWEKHGIRKPFRFLGYCLSLLNLPVISGMGNAIDKHLSDKENQKKIDEIWSEIASINQEANDVESVEESIKIIAEVIQQSPKLADIVEEYINDLTGNISEFKMIAENNSFNSLNKSIVDADISVFLTDSSSRTDINKSSITSKKTIIHTKGDSKTNIDGSTFKGEKGSVSMHGIRTQGPISVQDSGIGFGAGGGIIFGGNPNIVSGNCPHCGRKISISKIDLQGYTKIKCPHCQGISNIQI